MTVLVAPDSFKGSLSSRQAAAVIASAIAERHPGAAVDELPLSDGGEGLIDALQPVLGGERRLARVAGPLGAPVDAEWLLLPGGREALLESAACLGITLLGSAERDPRRSSSRGLGELLRVAASSGARRIWLGLGGTATNDGGLGMAQALGFRFLPEPVEGGDIAGTLIEVTKAIPSESIRWSDYPEVVCLADVESPLLGPSGASRTFARQKGASDEDIDALERALESYSTVVRRDIAGVDVDAPGMGAAGGLGFGCAAFCRAELRSGIETVLDLVDFTGRCAGAGLVITGEGRVDAQTRLGKVVSGVSRHAARLGRPVLVVAGAVDGDPRALARQLGVAAVIAAAPEGMPEEERLRRAPELLRAALVEHAAAIVNPLIIS